APSPRHVSASERNPWSGSSSGVLRSGPHAEADKDRWRELSLYGVDGSTLRVADSDENRAHFGSAKSKRGDSGYPLARIVGLMALRSHLLAAVAFGPYT